MCVPAKLVAADRSISAQALMSEGRAGRITRPPLAWRGAADYQVMMTETRIIRTARLHMAPHGLPDFAEQAAMWADPAVVKYIGGIPATTEDAWARLLRVAGSWSLLGYGMWAVRDAVNDTYLGDIGFLEAKRTGVSGFNGDPEIGWTLNTSAHGKGYASEAVAAALAWGTGRFKRTVAMIHPENTPSEAVAIRAGFHRFADATYKDAPAGLWEYIY
jgi:RimJ/RimL family protein N-acetyltransferase